jgi:anaerobic ribonucleoside-triphosphate reductase
MADHICPKCHKEMPATCPKCGKEVEVYSRIVGYLRPIKTWNVGKVEEFRQRKEYIINERWHGE